MNHFGQTFRRVWLFWLLVLNLCGLALPCLLALPVCYGGQATPLLTVGYDVQNEHRSASNGTAETASDYDTPLMPHANGVSLRRFLEGVAAEGGTTLYRAVGPAELADIQANNLLRNLGSAEGKYFTTSAEAASSYAKQAVSAFGDPPYTLIQTRVPNSIFEGLTPATVDRGIPAWVIPNNRLPGLVPQVLDTMPIPRP